jgi:hypothetical protein
MSKSENRDRTLLFQSLFNTDSQTDTNILEALERITSAHQLLNLEHAAVEQRAQPPGEKAESGVRKCLQRGGLHQTQWAMFDSSTGRWLVVTSFRGLRIFLEKITGVEFL